MLLHIFAQPNGLSWTVRARYQGRATTITRTSREQALRHALTEVFYG